MEFERFFTQFIQERRFLKNSSELTILFYKDSWKVYKRFCSDINKQELTKFVLGMREAGTSPVTCNVRIRGMNSFLSWLHEQELTAEHLRIKQLKVEQKVKRTFTDEHIKALISWRPLTFTEHRLHALVCLLIDTGARVREALSLRSDDVDLDNLLIRLTGKGNKQRVIPMSLELRKVLYHFKKKHDHDFVFPSRNGGKLLYDNTRRDFQALCTKLGIEGVDGSFHAFRRKFAKSYVKNGGNVFFLMKQLGHTTIAMSKKYVEADEEDLAQVHTRTSLLSRLR